MAVADAGARKAEARRADWARKYPPLATMGVALLVALVVLPSSLNLPQANPTETVEYAPVPPDDKNNNAPQGGNFAGLGLGRSAGIGAASLGVDGEQQALRSRNNRATRRRPPALLADEEEVGVPIDPGVNCSGNPPRQTFDPLSPPCVSSWDGGNPGATYGMGVSEGEVRLVLYFDGGINYINASDAQNRVSPRRELFDLWKPPGENQKFNGHSATQPEHLVVKGLRAWQTYFSDRFQTYGRDVHFFVYFSDGPTDATPERRRENADYLLKEVQPFAVISFASEGAEDDFLIAMARKGVLNFGSFALREEAFFQRFPKLIWSYLPSTEQQAKTFGDYVCRKVVGQEPVLASTDLRQQNAADPDYRGKRKLGVLYTKDPDWPGLTRMKVLIEEKVNSCGGKFEEEAVFPNCCLAFDNGETPSYAAQDMANFKQKGITTVIWAGGLNGAYGKVAQSIGYNPEWVIAGDSLIDANGAPSLSQNTTVFDGRAIVISPQVLEPGLEQRTCFRAFREVDRQAPRPDVAYVCSYYPNLFQFFVGVQVAGPYLNPTQVDKGFHAIPQREVGEPTVPACFYLPGDYTCIKDAQAEIWDADSRPPGAEPDSNPGCWRSIQGGQRYLSHGQKPRPWPDGNTTAQFGADGVAADPEEPCNGYSRSTRFNLA